MHARLQPSTQVARRQHDDRDKVVRQVIVSNVDTALLVMGLDHDFNLRRLERYLAAVQLTAIDAVVVLTKADLCADAPSRLAEVRSVLPGAVAARPAPGWLRHRHPGAAHAAAGQRERRPAGRFRRNHRPELGLPLPQLPSPGRAGLRGGRRRGRGAAAQPPQAAARSSPRPEDGRAAQDAAGPAEGARAGRARTAEGQGRRTLKRWPATQRDRAAPCPGDLTRPDAAPVPPARFARTLAAPCRARRTVPPSAPGRSRDGQRMAFALPCR
ncbi:MAG: GTPase RsgA [Burkholderiales bacterium]|nr:GTPase RsgA [Burkholderiales bacterium]